MLKRFRRRIALFLSVLGPGFVTAVTWASVVLLIGLTLVMVATAARQAWE